MVTPVTLNPDVGMSLTLAVIDSSDAPLLLLDDKQTIIAASRSFCRAFQIVADVTGRRLSDIGNGEWSAPQLAALLDATGSGFAEVEAYEMDLKRDGHDARRLVLGAHKLNYADTANVRLLLTITDVTEARLNEKHKDDLLREKAILLQELQHRVANSLQIVASVLMQSARKVQSDEARVHLTDAHSRVMSVAALQQQLTASRIGAVELRPYFTALCNSLGASMIHDASKVKLEVQTDDSVSTADVSVSLGLIVTELVINALKHAFPGRNREGVIKVSYRSDRQSWSLTVGDNGIGMPVAPAIADSGLGSSIVAALAKQLGATVTVTDAKPGTAVAIVRA